MFTSWYGIYSFARPRLASLEDLIVHGLHALRETLQQDKELTVQNTTIGIIGPACDLETSPLPNGVFRMLEEEKVEPFLQRLPPKETTAPPPLPAAAADVQPEGGAPPAGGDEDVQMAG